VTSSIGAKTKKGLGKSSKKLIGLLFYQTLGTPDIFGDMRRWARITRTSSVPKFSAALALGAVQSLGVPALRGLTPQVLGLDLLRRFQIGEFGV
jgi:hypothetical protein